MAEATVASQQSLILKAPPTLSSFSQSLSQQSKANVFVSPNHLLFSYLLLFLRRSTFSPRYSLSPVFLFLSQIPRILSSLLSLISPPGSAVDVSTNGRFSSVTSPKCAASHADQLKSAREDIRQLLKSKHCHPILVRPGWHDAGTYNKNVKEWPQRSGANGSLRFEAELKYKSNTGLVNALKLIQPIKDKYPVVTYADLFQLASATAIEEAGGPRIPMKYGRADAPSPNYCPEEGRLPGK
ncbi:putative L-ascorbate peroxidase 6 [Hibiscus syriacus]|uniref:L-ascorbate peroxidase 6 n=1 Tax=Hibiscus syriacus TaxID=106335 RepID=A0A6A2YY43_HIBSY|nr:putative L-ascorbate peroxidase 6 [Hibiscus syriacus]